MIRVLHGFGVLNAALWLGSTLFFSFVAGPAFFSDDMLRLLGRPHAGAAAQVVLGRYFILQEVCALIAVAHLIAEALYLGRPLYRRTLALLVALLVLVCVGDYGFQPKLHSLHRTMYRPGTPVSMQQMAERSFRIWHGVSQVFNLLVVAGVSGYFFRVALGPTDSRVRN
jgi:hypothetical protein